MLSRPYLLPESSRSTARTTQYPCASCRGVRPSALGLRSHGARGMVNGAGLLGHAEGRLTQPCCSFYSLACSDYRALLPRRPSWRLCPATPARRDFSARVACACAAASFQGTTMLGPVESYQMHLSCCFGPLSCSLGCVLPAGSLFRPAAGEAARPRVGSQVPAQARSMVFGGWRVWRDARRS